MAKRRLPDAKQQQTITAYIRAGGYPHVAAEAAGVPRAVFEKWLRQGSSRGGGKLCRQFARSVVQAAAQARLGAEVAVYKSKPLDWLRSGPGRELPDNPGWTTPVKAWPRTITQDKQITLGELQPLLEALTSIPQARVIAGEHFDRLAEKGLH